MDGSVPPQIWGGRSSAWTHVVRPYPDAVPSPPPFLRYVLVGGLGTSINYASFAVLLRIAPYPAAAAAAYLIGTLAAYALNRRWTFGISDHRSRYLLRYVTVQLAGMAATVAVLSGLVEILGVPVLLGQLLAIAAGTLTTFQLNRRWSFAEPA